MPDPEKSLLGTPPDFTLPGTNNPAGQNGRVTFSPTAFSNSYAGLPGFETQIAVEPDFQADMLRGNWESTPISTAFFSSQNVEILQDGIRRAVFDRSKGKYTIDKQSVDELKIIMRAMYYQYSRNMPTNVAGIQQQVNDLNLKVIDWSAPHILSAVDHYHYYLKDISNLPVPMQHPQSLSSAGTKSLPLQPFM